MAVLDRPLAAGVGGSLLLHAALLVALELFSGGGAAVSAGGETTVAGTRISEPIAITLVTRESEATKSIRSGGAGSPERAVKPPRIPPREAHRTGEDADSRRDRIPRTAPAGDKSPAVAPDLDRGDENTRELHADRDPLLGIGADESAGAAVDTAAGGEPAGGRGETASSVDEPTIVPPEPVHEIHRPPYPIAAKKRGYEGTVEIRIMISPSGQIVSHDLVASSGYEVLDHAALQAVLGAQFRPGTVNGRRQTLPCSVKVVFILS